MARSKSSKRWLNEHFDDEYVRRAQQEGYRSRAVYKLIEIQQKDHILKPGMTVIDLGAAQGPSTLGRPPRPCPHPLSTVPGASGPGTDADFEIFRR